MKANMSLGQFRAEIESYSSFQIKFDAPLNPFFFSATFDHATVVLSASPYIALKNSSGYLCINHIQAIKKRGKAADYQSYIFLCNDYTRPDEPTPVKFILNCA